MNPTPLSFGVPMFEDIYGNKMSDTEFHTWVNRELNDGQGIDYPFHMQLDDPFRS